ncbi:mitochondrial carrier domain-containing protein [Sporodiniella umbellata]|nr:mitochondrial carrier domain-containing protein [Sporodiniella umbellata]
MSERFFSLYRGLSVTLLFSVPALTVYLTVYATIKSKLNYLGLFWLGQEYVVNHAISGLLAEAAAGVFFTPMEVIKSQLQICNHFTTLSLIQHMAQQDGLKGFYRGYWITLGVFVPHSVAYFVVYEYLKSFYTEPTLIVYVICAATASAIGIMVSTPLDIVKTRWQVSSQEQCYREGPLKIAIHMWQHEGKYLAFTQGLAARIAWGIPLTTINMVVFEFLLILL